MTFTVTYRGADGALREEAVEAVGRSECFAECKARGIVPVRVKEGKRKGGGKNAAARDGGGATRATQGGGSAKRADQSGAGRPGSPRHPGQPRQPGRKARTWGLGVLGVLGVLAIVAGGAWWWLAAREDACPPEPAPVKAKPVEKPKAKPAAVPVTNSAPKLVRHRKPKTVPKVTADVGAPPDLPMFEEAPRRYGEINGSNIWPRALFKTREENMVAGLVTAKPGTRIVLSGFMPGEEERLLASLDIPVEFEDIDTPDERKVKEYMVGVKAELKAAVAKGEKITDIIQDMRNELNSYANYRDKLRMAHHLAMKEGTPKEAEEFRQEANKMLEEYGMDPIPIRSTQRARLGLDQ